MRRAVQLALVDSTSIKVEALNEVRTNLLHVYNYTVTAYSRGRGDLALFPGAGGGVSMPGNEASDDYKYNYWG